MTDRPTDTIDVETRGPWVARVEDEEISHDGSTRMEAVAAALDAFCGMVDAGWHDLGDYTVHVWSGCTFRHHNPDGYHAAGSMDERHDWVVDECTDEPSVRASVYEDTEGEICWRLEDD